LTIDSSPYAEIFVDGRKIGITPLVRIPLSPGRHVVRAVAANGDVEKLTIRVKPGEAQSRRVRFPDMRN
jgi:serine/threonine-protein kinase